MQGHVASRVSCHVRRRARGQLALCDRSTRLKSVTTIATRKRRGSKIRRHHARLSRRRTSVSRQAHSTWQTSFQPTNRVRRPSSTARQTRINATQWSRLLEDAIRPMRRIRLASTSSRPMRRYWSSSAIHYRSCSCRNPRKNQSPTICLAARTEIQNCTRSPKTAFSYAATRSHAHVPQP